MQQDVLYLSFSYIINFEFSLIPKQSYWWLAIQLCRSSICVHSLFHLPKHPQATTCLDEWLSIKPLMLSLKYCFCCIIKLRIKNWSWKMHSWMKLASIHILFQDQILCAVSCVMCNTFGLGKIPCRHDVTFALASSMGSFLLSAWKSLGMRLCLCVVSQT